MRSLAALAIALAAASPAGAQDFSRYEVKSAKIVPRQP